MMDPSFNKLMRSMAGNDEFAKIIEVSEESKEKQKDMEYVSRFLAYTYTDYDGSLDIEEYVDESLMQIIARKANLNIEDDFKNTFSLLMDACGKDSLRRFDGKKFSGRIGYTAFEIIAIGIARNIAFILDKKNPEGYVSGRIHALWKEGHPDTLVYGGMRGTTRISRTIPFGEGWFKNG